MREAPAGLPVQMQRFYINFQSFEHADAMRRLVGEKQRVLLIGDGGGRDYFFLRQTGKEVVAVDVALQPNIPNLLLADPCEGLPFASKSFDAVVMADVLEHLVNDFEALRNVRAVLKDDGYLVLAVPFYNDSTPTHVRIHSPTSLRRLLAAAGFEVVDYVERGGLINFERLRVWPWLWHGFHYVLWRLTGRTHYRPLLRLLVGIDWELGRRRFWALRRTAYYGARLRCQKTAPLDFRLRNIEDFTEFITKVTDTRSNRADGR